MSTSLPFEHYLNFINTQLHPAKRLPLEERARVRAVTISRMAGCGAHVIGEKLCEQLTARASNGDFPWTLFDRNLVAEVLNDHHLPAHLAQFMPEDRISEMGDTLDELFGLHPPSSLMVRQTAETILRLADLGNVVIVGRGGNIITSRLDYAFHVRLVGSPERRMEYLRQYNGLDRKAAMAFIRREDRGRERYLKKYFQKDIHDPLLYHLVINTDTVAHEEAARLIADAVQGRGGARNAAARNRSPVLATSKA